MQEDNADKLGTDKFEVSWHGTARPEHQEWQGKVYTKEQLASVCGLGSVTGLLGANCRHTYFPFIKGVSKRIYTDEQLRAMNERENEPKYYNGKPYTSYEATQRQRYLETSMRAQRQKIKLLEEAGADEQDITLAKCKYRRLSQEYTAFSKQMGLSQERDRIYADGLGKIDVKIKEVSIVKNENSDIILARSLDRKSSNIGAFSSLSVTMQKREVKRKRLCYKYGLDIKGLTFKIQRSENLLSLPYCGSTDYDNIGKIDLFPNAFRNEEELIKTIIHESCHVEQLKKYGKKYCLQHLADMEAEAYQIEKEIFNKLTKGEK